MSCSTCGNDTWFDASDSSTFEETAGTPYYVSNGVFIGACNNATDTVSATSDSSLAIEDFPFCYLTGLKNNLWDYSAALSFGRFQVYEEFLNNSYVGLLHENYGYEPVATFDLGSDESAVYIGSYNVSDGDSIVGSVDTMDVS